MSSLNTESRARIIAALKTTMEEKYIFPEKAQELSAYLDERHHAGFYDSYETIQDFADCLTADVQLFTKDGHLRLYYNPSLYEQLLETQDDSEDEDFYSTEALDELRYDNYLFQKVERLIGNVGYLRLDNFIESQYAGETAIAAMNFLGNCDALIFDLRWNGGGSPNMVQLLTSYLFEQTKHLNTFYWRPTDKYEQFWTQAYVSGKKFINAPIYVLTSPRTFSAAEEFTYNLKNMGRATIVGETTGGGAHPGDNRALSDGVCMFVAMGRSINPITQTDWEGTGISPDLPTAVDDALNVAHRHALETLLEQSPNEKVRAIRQWELETIQAQQNPLSVDPDILQGYVGTYGAYRMSLKEGKLNFAFRSFKGDLHAINETLFRDTVNPKRRFKFIRAENETQANTLQVLFINASEPQIIQRNQS